jgi:molybdopterin-containing oxidoreductase family iron-sulfur binding subunit
VFFKAAHADHASTLSLYDNGLKSPKIAGKDASWSTVDAKIKSSIKPMQRLKVGKVVLLTNTLASPLLKN